MSGEDEYGRLVRESTRKKRIVGGLALSYLLTVLANAAAGHGPVDGWLGWIVVLSAFLLMMAFGITFIWRLLDGRPLHLDDQPQWTFRVAAVLAVAVLMAAVTIVVTP